MSFCVLKYYHYFSTNNEGLAVSFKIRGLSQKYLTCLHICALECSSYLCGTWRLTVLIHENPRGHRCCLGSRTACIRLYGFSHLLDFFIVKNGGNVRPTNLHAVLLLIRKSCAEIIEEWYKKPLRTGVRAKDRWKGGTSLLKMVADLLTVSLLQADLRRETHRIISSLCDSQLK